MRVAEDDRDSPHCCPAHRFRVFPFRPGSSHRGSSSHILGGHCKPVPLRSIWGTGRDHAATRAKDQTPKVLVITAPFIPRRWSSTLTPLDVLTPEGRGRGRRPRHPMWSSQTTSVAPFGFARSRLAGFQVPSSRRSPRSLRASPSLGASVVPECSRASRQVHRHSGLDPARLPGRDGGGHAIPDEA